jgi:hypothetical protein
MSTANSKLKIDFGYDSFGTSNVQGSLGITGDLSVGGNLAFSGTTVGNFIPDADQRSLGNTVNRWNLIGFTANLASTLTVTGSTSLQDTLSVTKTISGGNTTIAGFANVTTSVNSALLTVGTSFIANTTGAYHTGVVNAGSLSTSGFVINTTAFAPTSNTLLLGNTSGRFVISANTGNFSGDVTIAGNTTVNNATLNGTLQTISGNVNFDSGALFVDSINNRIGIGITSPTVSLDVSGSANVSSGVNSSSFTIGSSLVANTTGVYHAGTVNADSHTVGSNFAANSTAVTSTGIANLTAATSSVRVGNSTVNSFVNSSSVLTSVGIFSTSANVGSNVGVSTSGIQIGNSTANLNANSILVSVADSTSTSNISSTGFVVGSFNANNSTMTVNVGSFVIGANVGSNVNLTTSDLQIGNSTSNIFANSVLLKISDSSSTANLSSSSLTIGSAIVNSTVLTITTGNFSTGANVGANVNLTTSTFQIGNSSVNTQVNSTSISTNTGNFSLAANVGANVKLTTVILSIGNSTVNSTVNSTTFFTTGTANVGISVNSALFKVGTDFIANTSGVYHTGTVNAGSFTVTNFVANTAGIYHSGIVNAAFITIGTSFIANTTGAYVNTTSINSTSINSTSVNATSFTVGSNFIANTTGMYHTGVANAASTRVSSLGVGVAATGTAGEIIATNAITAYYSDERLKTRIGPIENALNKVNRLSGFYYHANEIAQSMGYEVKKEVGVSAQEVMEVQPEVVAPAPIDNNYLTVRYERLVPLLIEAIKELKTELDTLKVQINELTNGNS